METTFEDELTALTAKCRNCIRAGRIDQYSKTLKEMAMLFQCEKRFRDQLKMLVISFYIDLSGFGRAAYIDHAVVKNIRNAVSVLEMGCNELEQLYFIWIHPDMITQHTMSVKDSWYLMRLCLEGKIEQAEWALAKV